MKRLLLILAALLIAGGVTITIRIGGQPAPEAAPPVIEGLPIEDAPPDVTGPEGWSGAASLQITAAWAAQQPKFQLVHPDSGEPVWQDNASATLNDPTIHKRRRPLLESVLGVTTFDNLLRRRVRWSAFSCRFVSVLLNFGVLCVIYQ